MTKQEDSGHSFLAYFKRATSPLAVLRILSDRPMYGYELIQELKQRSGGKYQLSLLYPVLYRLEEQGYLEISSSEIVDGRAGITMPLRLPGGTICGGRWPSMPRFPSCFSS